MQKDTVRRDRFFYGLVHHFVGIPFLRAYRFSSEEYTPAPSPYLVVSNHTTDFDPVFLGCAFAPHMYFVASEHVFRKGILSRLLVWVFHPIARVKGATDASCAMDIIRKLRGGHNVCLFAEGNRSFNGKTGPVFPATGKLAKAARCTLVTYRISGGYLATPRWSRSRRKGPITGKVVNVYTPEQLAAMTPGQINALIQADIDENAYASNRAAHVAYKGKNLAEKLELALYLCPHCRKTGTLTSSGDRFSCPCGLSVRMDEYGSFADGGAGAPPFENVLEWDLWQEEAMTGIVNGTPAGTTLFSDENAVLTLLDGSHGSSVIAEGTASCSPDALRCGELEIAMADISDMAVCGPAKLVFSIGDGCNMELTGKPSFSVRKYLRVFQITKSKG